MNKVVHPLVVLLAAVAPLAGCDPSKAPPHPVASEGVDVLATVNGVPITERDVEHRARRPGAAMGMGPASEPSPVILQAVVQDEIIQQKAVELGLDRDPEYRVRLDDLEAQVRLFRRRELASKLRAWAQEHASVSEAEARAWFDENAALVRTRFHVLQLFNRGRLTDLLEASAEVRQGAPFEEVARRRLGGPLAQGRAPWDLGELSWYQLPPAWRGIVDRLRPGEVSDVIRGEGERGWIVKLAGARVDPGITFDTERERVLALLRASRADALLARTIAEARAAAAVTFSPARPRPATRTASAE